MSQNHHISSPECAAAAPLLPLAAHDLLSEPDEARLRAHLATCARCRSELADYAAVERALLRSFAPRQGARLPFSREELMDTLDHPADHPEDHPTPAAPPLQPETPPRRTRRTLTGISAVAAMLAIVLIAALLFAMQFHSKIPSPATRPNPTPARGSQTWLKDVSMVSATEGWAVGYGTPANHPDSPTIFLMHYTHGAWSPVPSSIPGQLNSVSMVSAHDGWAVGDGFILHYNGETWQPVVSPTRGGLSAVQMLSATDGWAVGGQTGASILHYDGQRWTSQPLPASLGPNAVNTVVFEHLSMISPNEGWIVGETIPQADTQAPDGSYYPTKPPNALILHYTHGAWTVQQIIQGASLHRVAIASATEGWAVGETDAYTPGKTGGPGTIDKTASLLVRYSGGVWTKVANPLATPNGQYEGSLTDVVLLSPTDGWLVGTALVDTPGLMHYNGKGWTPVNLPAPATFKDNIRFYTISSIAMISATDGWAVGERDSTREAGIPVDSGAYLPTITPLLLHYHNGAWSAA